MNSTITSRENWLRFLRGEKPEWMPVYSETQAILPAIVPDNVARGFVNETVQVSPDRFGGPDMFGVPWVYEPQVGGSMEDPAHPPILRDVADWREVIRFPDIDSWDWEGATLRNRGFLDPTRLTTATVFSSFFERLISFMGFEAAAMAMIDEDCEEDLHALFDALADANIRLIANYKKFFDIDLVYFHDDWGAQLAPFFSLNTCREMLVPHISKVVDFCHKNGVFFEFHCCGHNDMLAPAMVEAGMDAWCGQPMCDKYALLERYGDKMAIGISFTAAPEEVLRAQIDEMLDRVKLLPPGRRVYARDRMLGKDTTLRSYLIEKTRELYR